MDALAAGDAEQAIASLLRTGLTPDETKLVQLYRRLNATQKAGVRGLIEGFLQAEPISGPQRFPGPVGQMSNCH